MTTTTPTDRPDWQRHAALPLVAYAPGRRPDGSGFGAEEDEDEEAAPEDDDAPAPSAPKTN